ncbi:proline-specific peptidase [Myriangium duriaei CBS 260.36]|uniref:Proline-specific peptidase n=1 Tax=Myriangium duriaei CBS 260.36 TaxID=1168546 RepID=A0A9P4MIL4_9PEZI|nr:proline-specific peptidase [Myriangium duriaei CBS 260.36]
MSMQSRSGTVPFRIPSIDRPCFTFYKVFGELSSDRPAVVCAHGGPGAGHEYLLPFAELWPRYGLPVVFYDQIGCASSTHLEEKAGNREFWQDMLFIDELDNLLDHLQLRSGAGFHLLGHSWGGMLCAQFATKRPRGLRKLVLASALASFDLLVEGVEERKRRLTVTTQKALEEGEKSGNFHSEEYTQALVEFQGISMGIDPSTPELGPAMQHLSEDTTVYTTMYGTTMAMPDGSLRGWTCISGLPFVEAETLIYNGVRDSSQDTAQIPFFELIPRARWRTFDTGHMAHLEGTGKREEVLKLVGEFLESF